MSSEHILDRFLNILPTVTIREGSRVKVYLSDDLLLPDYAQHTQLTCNTSWEAARPLAGSRAEELNRRTKTMKHITKKSLADLCSRRSAAFARRFLRAVWFGGIVYDPTNYQNACAPLHSTPAATRPAQQTYQQSRTNTSLRSQMAKNLDNMPARYRAAFSEWRSFSAPTTSTGTLPDGSAR